MHKYFLQNLIMKNISNIYVEK